MLAEQLAEQRHAATTLSEHGPAAAMAVAQRSQLMPRDSACGLLPWLACRQNRSNLPISFLTLRPPPPTYDDDDAMLLFIAQVFGRLAVLCALATSIMLLRGRPRHRFIRTIPSME